MQSMHRMWAKAYLREHTVRGNRSFCFWIFDARIVRFCLSLNVQNAKKSKKFLQCKREPEEEQRKIKNKLN